MMNRRFFLKAIPVAGMASAIGNNPVALAASALPALSDREYNVKLLLRIADPVIK